MSVRAFTVLPSTSPATACNEPYRASDLYIITRASGNSLLSIRHPIRSFTLALQTHYEYMEPGQNIVVLLPVCLQPATGGCWTPSLHASAYLQVQALGMLVPYAMQQETYKPVEQTAESHRIATSSGFERKCRKHCDVDVDKETTRVAKKPRLQEKRRRSTEKEDSDLQPDQQVCQYEVPYGERAREVCIARVAKISTGL
jgi:hypothetical protein